MNEQAAMDSDRDGTYQVSIRTVETPSREAIVFTDEELLGALGIVLEALKARKVEFTYVIKDGGEEEEWPFLVHEPDYITVYPSVVGGVVPLGGEKPPALSSTSSEVQNNSSGVLLPGEHQKDLNDGCH